METITEKHFEQSKPEDAGPRIVKFVNFSKEDFTWSLNKVPYTFPAGSVKYMSFGVANHFAKHLVNRELLRKGRENDTSPKTPGDNPFFMELFNQCIQPVADAGETDQTKIEEEAIDRNMKEKLGKKEMHSNIESPKKGKDKKISSKKKVVEEEKEFEDIEVPPSDDDAE